MDSLNDPITYEMMVIPIILPCGHTFDKTTIEQLATPDCPICRAEFDPDNLVVNYLVSQLIDEHKERQMPQVRVPNSTPTITPGWHVNCLQIQRPPTQPQFKTPVVSIEVECGDATILNSVKTLALLVVDVSGSMAGGPIRQVKDALTTIMDITRNNTTVHTNIILYNHQVTFNVRDINTINATGGTNFNVAFNGIVEAIKQHKEKEKYGKCVVFIMTDGEDGSQMSKPTMLQTFKQQLEQFKSVDGIECVVHTLGFSQQHDFNFLNDIRKCGCVEGTYQYANPADSSDVLYQKTVAIARAEVTTSSVPIEMIETTGFMAEPKVTKMALQGGKTIVWHDKPIDSTVLIRLPTGSVITVPVTHTSTTKGTYLLRWYSQLVDNIIGELVPIQKYTGEYLQLCIELLRERTKSIANFVNRVDDVTSVEMDALGGHAVTNIMQRIKYIQDTLTSLANGIKIDQMQLTDMTYGSRYATATTSTTAKKPVVTSAPQTNIIVNPEIATVNVALPTSSYGPLEKCNISFDIHNGSCGNTYLHDIAACGNLHGCKRLLEDDPDKFKNSLNACNDDGCTPLDLAAMCRGYWWTVEFLLENGAKCGVSDRMILNRLMTKRYYRTAQALLNYNKLRIYDTDYKYFNNRDVREWLADNVTRDPYENSMYIIRNGLHDKVHQINFTTQNINAIPELFNKPSKGHLQVLKYLVEQNIVDINQEIILKNGDKSNILFVAAQNGSVDLLTMVMATSKLNLNYQNDKGTTPLWIACCNLHIDVVGMLLMAGADPNICNYKGDSPLIPACQKGSLTIVQMLVDTGCNINTKNKNGDTVIILCCRNGQHQILQYLLSQMSKEVVEQEMMTFSDIDGFNPMFAAVELDRFECIKVLHSIYPKLDYVTSSTNAILPDASPLHLAAFYGRLNAFKTLVEDLGMDINGQTTSGVTALHLAIKHKQRDIVEYIMSHGGQMLHDSDGHTPMYYAKMSGNESIYNEFFRNPLLDKIKKYILTESASAIYDILKQFATSHGCFDLCSILEADAGANVSLIALAYAQQNKPLIELIEQSGIVNTLWYNLSRKDTSDVRVQRVMAAVLKNFQNKLLLTNETPKTLMLLDIDSVEMLEHRMMNNFTLDLVDISKTMEMLSKSPPIALIMGLLNNLPKMTKLSVNEINTMLTLVKSRNIEMVANGSTFEPTYMFLLGLYTLSTVISDNVNDAVANYSITNDWNNYVINLYKGLQSLPAFVGECYRRMNGYFYVPIGTTFTASTFGTATSEWGHMTLDKTTTVFIVKSKTGRDISAYSMFPQNKEIMFLPNTTFKVVNYYQNNVIVLGQANIRQTSYAARDKDIENAINKKATLIVELEEV